MNATSSTDPYEVLGLPRAAGEAEVRARYLELVKQFPPEREPERFREIRAAFDAAQDPLVMASRLLEPPSDQMPQWADAIEAQKKNPPRLSPTLLVSLGNRAVNPPPSTP